MAKKKAFWLLLPIAPQSTILLITILTENGGKALSIWVQYLALVELRECYPASSLVVPLSVVTQEIHCSIYGASHIVDHNALESHQENEVLPLLEDPFLYTKHLGEIVQGFWTILIKLHTLWYCHNISYLVDYNLVLLY